MKIILSIFGLLILFFPTALKVWRDRNGVKHPDPTFILLVCLMMACGNFVWVIMNWDGWTHDYIQWIIQASRYVIVSAAFYASIFPYLVNYVHLKNGVTEARIKIKSLVVPTYVVAEYLECTKKEVFIHIVSHLSKTAWPDKTWWWRALGWNGRLIVNALILIGGLILFFYDT